MMKKAGYALAWMLITGLLLTGVSAFIPATNPVSFLLSVVLPTLAPWMTLAALAVAGIALWRQKKALAILSAVGIIVPVFAISGQYAGANRAGNFGADAPLSLIRALAPSPIEAGAQEPREIHGMQVYGAGSAGERKPIVFGVHGGGWKDDAQMPATLQALADAGFVVIRPSYPLADAEHPTFESAPRAVADAYRWVGEHPAEFGGDANRVFVFGDSAGGGLGMNLAYRVAQGIDAGPRPRAVVALYPTVDLEAVEGVRAMDAYQAVRDYMGGSSTEYPERYRDQATATWASPEAPPTLIIQGSRDTFVPPESVQRFVEQAHNAGAEVHYVSVPLANHAFDTVAKNSLGQQLVARATASFFRAHA